jgi:hypothetical protein
MHGYSNIQEDEWGITPVYKVFEQVSVPPRSSK